MTGRLSALLILLLMTACRSEPEPVQAQRFSLDEARAQVAEPLGSPDTRGAAWRVAATGQAIEFGQADTAPWLTLSCGLRSTPATLTIVRHVPARPGQKALLPVLGNGTISRFKVDAALADGEWRWQGTFDASDPQLDVFTGPRELEATLPGGGTLLIEGSRIPGEFVSWCRAGGQTPRAEAAEQAEAAETPAPSASPPAR